MGFDRRRLLKALEQMKQYAPGAALSPEQPESGVFIYHAERFLQQFKFFDQLVERFSGITLYKRIAKIFMPVKLRRPIIRRRAEGAETELYFRIIVFPRREE